MSSFEGKAVLVTGANSGIGDAAARAFREAGAEVFGVVRRQDALDAARARHPTIHWLLADVTKEHEIQAAVETAVREAGRLDAVVNAALFLLGSIEPRPRSSYAVSSRPTSTVPPSFYALPCPRSNGVVERW